MVTRATKPRRVHARRSKRSVLLDYCPLNANADGAKPDSGRQDAEGSLEREERDVLGAVEVIAAVNVGGGSFGIGVGKVRTVHDDDYIVVADKVVNGRRQCKRCQMWYPETWEGCRRCKGDK